MEGHKHFRNYVHLDLRDLRIYGFEIDFSTKYRCPYKLKHLHQFS